MKYIGDLSISDVNILAEVSRTASSIIEFGSGASTQIFAQASPRAADIMSVETDGAWIMRTRTILEAIGHSDRVVFKDYTIWASELTEPPMPIYDVIFDDGTDPLRADFAIRTWPRLKIGGKLLFHDTRRPNDAQNLLQFCLTHFLEVDSIQLNTGSSNISVVTKKLHQPYQDWNVCEGRTQLLVGWGPLDESIAYMRGVDSAASRPALSDEQPSIEEAPEHEADREPEHAAAQ